MWLLYLPRKALKTLGFTPIWAVWIAWFWRENKNIKQMFEISLAFCKILCYNVINE